MSRFTSLRLVGGKAIRDSRSTQATASRSPRINRYAVTIGTVSDLRGKPVETEDGTVRYHWVDGREAASGTSGGPGQRGTIGSVTYESGKTF
ncbi:hypothetical protein GCM10011574_25290 [Microbispora bryophytorum]|uniref:Uncharacterized protein n=1 Tax=Microbispora bryophytorum TaxID=1460882 RepID=A0A8H9GXT4_9ACTN|nr:hypothetical protein GCM10011574_25290 [Microbispora bryophytorum]